MGKSTISMAIFNFQDLKVEKWWLEFPNPIQSF